MHEHTLNLYTMLSTPFQLAIHQYRTIRSVTQDVKYLPNNIIFQYTNPLPFEKETQSLHTIPLTREHLDPYLYYNNTRHWILIHRKTNSKSYLAMFKTSKLEPIIEQSTHKVFQLQSKIFFLHI